MAFRNTVLVHAPVGRDSELVVRILARAGVLASPVTHLNDVFELARTGNAGALLMTAEALTRTAVTELSDALGDQPHWSDLPVLILVPGGRGSALIDHLELSLLPLPNLTLLERPIRPVTLTSVARNALRSRSRQYEVQRIMDEQEHTALAMMQSEKLVAVGRLASSIAHEINNPLEAVTNLLYLVRGEEGLTQPVRDYLETADRELARVSQIASQTLRFHRQSTSATLVRPESLLNEVLEIYRTRLTNSDVVVSRDHDPRLQVTCYEGDIRQVLSNLVGNAFDVMRNGGTLRLRTRELTWWSTEQRGVMFTIADDGAGMTMETQKRIFEAFYSTKGIQGTGLGLWISKRIIHKHRGHLLVRSRMGKGHGTVFHLWLPYDLADSAKEAWHTDDGEEILDLPASEIAATRKSTETV